VDYKVILNLMKEMNHTDLTKLEIEEEGIRICIEKAVPTVNVAQSQIPNALFSPGLTQIPPQMPMQQPVVTITPAAAAAEVNSEKPSEELSGRKLVSPMVGTYYSASSPDKPPFVKVGDKVKKGQPICIIEAMKLMNEIEAEQDGEIVKVLAANEQMVEFGQPLFLIK
jgi:acetyl-CoA carboxylase biotin carboxyl carrier protein